MKPKPPLELKKIILSLPTQKQTEAEAEAEAVGIPVGTYFETAASGVEEVPESATLTSPEDPVERVEEVPTETSGDGQVTEAKKNEIRKKMTTTALDAGRGAVNAVQSAEAARRLWINPDLPTPRSRENRKDR